MPLVVRVLEIPNMIACAYDLPVHTLNDHWLLFDLKVYSEVDGMECLLNYKSYSAGFCKILTHPKWGSAVYPATIFVYAPAGVARQLLEQHYPLAVEHASN